MNPSDEKWRKRFMAVAQTVATWSKDTTQVGAVIVSEDGLILSTGYNGLPRGVQDSPERMERPAKYLWTVHSEAAAIANAARHGVKTDGASIYCTHLPCSACARQIINAGIVAVYCGTGTTSMPEEEFNVSRTMFDEAGVRVPLVCL